MVQPFMMKLALKATLVMPRIIEMIVALRTDSLILNVRIVMEPAARPTKRNENSKINRYNCFFQVLFPMAFLFNTFFVILFL